MCPQNTSVTPDTARRFSTHYNDRNVNRFRNLIEALDAAPSDRLFITSWIDEDEQEKVTFGEFRQRARTQASALLESRVGPGDRVVIIMPQGIPAMAAFVGAMMIGAVPAFLAYPNFKIEPAKYRSGLSGVSANLSAKAVVIDDEFPDDMLGYLSLGEPAALVRAPNEVQESIELLAITHAPENLAFIQHSAGTTGLQKGVALTHAAVLRQIGHLSGALKIDAATDKIYSWLPLYHDMGLIACFILPMVCHLRVVMQLPLDWVMHPETTLQIVSEEKCTLAWTPNFALQFIPRRTPQSRWQQYDLSSLRALINCSEPVRAGSMQEFQRAFAGIGLRQNALHSSYAMAENVFAVTQSEIDRPDGPVCIWADGQKFRAKHEIARVKEETPGAIAFQSSGRLLPHHEMRVISGSGDLLDDGHVGEILLKSDCLFEGYFNRPDLTAEAIADGWYRTGDLGFVFDGELFVVGRKKDLLIVGGENLYPQDIEEIVSGHPAVHDGRAVAMGIYNPDRGTDDIVVVAEVEHEADLAGAAEIESVLRNWIVAGIGVSVRTIFFKPPKWIVKSTAGKPARSATREKLLREHPEINQEPERVSLS